MWCEKILCIISKPFPMKSSRPIHQVSFWWLSLHNFNQNLFWMTMSVAATPQIINTIKLCCVILQKTNWFQNPQMNPAAVAWRESFIIILVPVLKRVLHHNPVVYVVKWWAKKFSNALKAKGYRRHIMAHVHILHPDLFLMLYSSN